MVGWLRWEESGMRARGISYRQKDFAARHHFGWNYGKTDNDISISHDLTVLKILAGFMNGLVEQSIRSILDSIRGERLLYSIHNFTKS